MRYPTSLLLLLLAGSTAAIAQDYTSYRVGATTEKVVSEKGGICMMGGGTEVDTAMKWFLKQANGGDVLVLRTSGTDSYNSYLFNDLGVPLNSVETIVCHNANAATSAYLKQRILEAEAIWFAGGDQSVYVDYWRGTAVDSLINLRKPGEKLTIGGTSAGMAILGRRYFSAKNGTVTSADALANPFVSTLTVETAPFLKVKYLENIITDTHFDNPDRKGRAVVFLARTNFKQGFFDFDNLIGLDEHTALTIDDKGMGRVWGGSGNSDSDNAYFMRANCKNLRPEIMTAGMPLTWNIGRQALKAYHIKADSVGSNAFNFNLNNIPLPLRSLFDGQGAAGGKWQDWSVQSGVLTIQDSTAKPDCYPGSVGDLSGIPKLQILPNPAQGYVLVSDAAGKLKSGSLLNITGQALGTGILENGILRFELAGLPAGIYLLRVVSGNDVVYERLVKE